MSHATCGGKRDPTDGVVEATIVPGATNHMIPVHGHLRTRNDISLACMGRLRVGSMNCGSLANYGAINRGIRGNLARRTEACLEAV